MFENTCTMKKVKKKLFDNFKLGHFMKYVKNLYSKLQGKGEDE